MWHGILGHDEVVDRFRQTLAARRLGSTYLFVGPAGIGKKRFALELARCLLCQRSADDALEACGQCDSCRLFDGGNHPDLEVVGLPADKAELTISLFIGDDEHRNQVGLCHRMALKPFMSGRRVAIIDDADHFNATSANCLLKTLEEPPPHSLLILIGTSAARQLPTIRSRSQVVRFSPLTTNDVAQILLETGTAADREQALRLAQQSGGTIDRAIDLTDPALGEFRDALLKAIAGGRPDGVRLARQIQAFVDEAGKEPAGKRQRLRTVIGLVIEHFRTRLREASGGNDTEGGNDDALHALDASLTALEQIDRNANLGLVIQNWTQEFYPTVVRL
jgi:DNA polymerase III subunit delta'